MSSSPAAFELWLETEVGDPELEANRVQQNFCNVTITIADGSRYALNVWTFDFLPLARFDWPYESKETEKAAEFVLPPDLFVERLDRELLVRVFTELIAANEMKSKWLDDEND